MVPCKSDGPYSRGTVSRQGKAVEGRINGFENPATATPGCHRRTLRYLGLGTPSFLAMEPRNGTQYTCKRGASLELGPGSFNPKTPALPQMSSGRSACWKSARRGKSTEEFGVLTSPVPVGWLLGPPAAAPGNDTWVDCKNYEIVGFGLSTRPRLITMRRNDNYYGT